MKPYAIDLIHKLEGTLLNVNCKNSEVRNLITKLLQRIALVLLRKRFANWRYKCGYRNLEESLKHRSMMNNDKIESINVKEETNLEEEEDEAEIPYNLVIKF